MSPESWNECIKKRKKEKKKEKQTQLVKCQSKRILRFLKFFYQVYILISTIANSNFWTMIANQVWECFVLFCLFVFFFFFFFSYSVIYLRERKEKKIRVNAYKLSPFSIGMKVWNIIEFDNWRGRLESWKFPGLAKGKNLDLDQIHYKNSTHCLDGKKKWRREI